MYEGKCSLIAKYITMKGGNVLFTAITKEGRKVSLLDKNYERREEKTLKNQTYLCPVCKSSLVLKTGQQRVWHFAHVHDRNQCSGTFENESNYHLLGKKMLYQWLISQRKSVQLEPFLSSCQQRPDLLVEDDRGRWAIEFQCSSVPNELIIARTKTYEDAGIHPLWILGRKRLKQRNAHYLLSNFDSLFVRANARKEPYLLYFSPMTSQLLFLHRLYPFSPRMLTATNQAFSLQNLSLNDILTPQFTSHYRLNIDHWVKQKQKWRIHPANYFHFEQKRLRDSLYREGIQFVYMPAEIGVPVEHMIWFHSPCYIWQGHILLMIMKKDKGEAFSFRSIYMEFKNKVRTEQVRLRHLPFLSQSHYSFAIYSYLIVLCKIGILQKENRKWFKKSRDIVIPKTVEEAFKRDRDVLGRIK
jgi:competence protein CoiA